MVGNIAPRVIETVPRLVSGLGEIVEQLATYIPQVIQELLPPLMSGVQDLLNTLVGMLPEMISIIGQRQAYRLLRNWRKVSHKRYLHCCQQS